jgi:flagellar basal-body rod modification protein FlgD
VAVNSVGGIGQDQFLQLLLAQLQHQDPLAPADPSGFISQLSSLSTVQGLQTHPASVSQELQQEQLSQGVNLTGKTVDYTPPGGGTTSTGTVDGVAVNNGQFVLQVGQDQVGLDQIVNVRNQ